MFEIRKYNGRF